MQLKWGRVDVRFGTPLSLRSFIDEQKNNPTEAKILQSLGYQYVNFYASILSCINNLSVVMPTGLVGTVLLTLRGRGVGRNELIRKVIHLRNEIIKRGGTVADFGASTYGSVVDRAISVLGDLVGRRTDILEPVYYTIRRFPISFYRNQVIHLFIHESVLCVAIYATIKAGGAVKHQRVSRKKLGNDSTFISRLLKFEFVYKGGGIESNLASTLQNLLNDDVIAVDTENGEDLVNLSDSERQKGREGILKLTKGLTSTVFCYGLSWKHIGWPLSPYTRLYRRNREREAGSRNDYL